MIIISCKKTALQNKPFRFVLILVLILVLLRAHRRREVRGRGGRMPLPSFASASARETRAAAQHPCPLSSPDPSPCAGTEIPDGGRCFQRFTVFVPSLSWQNRSFSFENRSKRPPNKLKTRRFCFAPVGDEECRVRTVADCSDVRACVSQPTDRMGVLEQL